MGACAGSVEFFVPESNFYLSPGDGFFGNYQVFDNFVKFVSFTFFVPQVASSNHISGVYLRNLLAIFMSECQTFS